MAQALSSSWWGATSMSIYSSPMCISQTCPPATFAWCARARHRGAIDLISTRRPYDDPGVARVYYRLRLDPSSLLAKTYMPYALSEERFALWHEWF